MGDSHLLQWNEPKAGEILYLPLKTVPEILVGNKIADGAKIAAEKTKEGAIFVGQKTKEGAIFVGQ